MSSSTIPDDLVFPSKLTSMVWQHFQLSQTKSLKDYAWCAVKGCPPSRRRVARKKGNTRNLADHLRLYHPTLLRTCSSSSATSIRDQLAKQSVDSQVVPCTEVFRLKLDNLLARMFISNTLSFNVADSEDFIQAIHFATGASYL